MTWVNWELWIYITCYILKRIYKTISSIDRLILLVLDWYRIKTSKYPSKIYTRNTYKTESVKSSVQDFHIGIWPMQLLFKIKQRFLLSVVIWFDILGNKICNDVSKNGNMSSKRFFRLQSQIPLNCRITSSVSRI